MSDESVLKIANWVYYAALLLTVVASVAAWVYGNRVHRTDQERIAQADAASKRALVQQEKLRLENGKLQVELNKQKREAERFKRKIAGGALEQ